MFPDLSEYTWIVPDFVWELGENIDLGTHDQRLGGVFRMISVHFADVSVNNGALLFTSC